MRNSKVMNGAPNPMFLAKNNLLPQRKFGAFLYSDPSTFYSQQQNDCTVSNISNPTSKNGTASAVLYCTENPKKCDGNPNSPYLIMFPPWTHQFSVEEYEDNFNAKAGFAKHGLVGSLVYDSHIHSLAASGDFLYAGSDNKDLKVWKNLKYFSGLKSRSGLVKAIVVLGDKIFTGHHDGKIRIWRFCGDNNKRNMGYERVGSLPTTWDLCTKSINPRNYVKVKKKKSCPWIKHCDAVSCMSIDADSGLLYSGSWDKTLKVWRICDCKCLESIRAHDDAINSVVVAFDGLVFTGSADGTVKMWRREEVVAGKCGRKTKHVMVETLLKQEHAVTSLVVNHQGSAVVYAGSSDGLVNFWERVSGTYSLLYGGVLRGHKLAVLCLAVGGNLVLSGSADKTICVWRKENGGDHTCVAVLSGHGGPVKCLAVEEDGDQRWIVYSGSLDKSVKVWRVSDRGALKLKELE